MPLHGGSHGRHSVVTIEDDVDVAICTVEKANGIISRMLGDGRLDEFAVVVVDEVHMIGDGYRGTVLEVLLSKVRNYPDIQVVCMSATLPNARELALWMDAAFYEACTRPVRLNEYVAFRCDDDDGDGGGGGGSGSGGGGGRRSVSWALYDKHTWDSDGDPVMKVTDTGGGGGGGGGGGDGVGLVGVLCVESMTHHRPTLVFCARRTECQRLARRIADACRHHRTLAHTTPTIPSVDATTMMQRRRLLLHELSQCPEGIDEILKCTVMEGVAYHHAGLLPDERTLVENAYRDGVLLVLMATSTLAAGVNLPAHRVIFASPFIGSMPLRPAQYQQMCGRAGRAGLNNSGESILVCGSGGGGGGRGGGGEDDRKHLPMIFGDLPPLMSQFADGADVTTINDCALQQAVLEAIVCGLAKTADDVVAFMNTTLYAHLAITTAAATTATSTTTTTVPSSPSSSSPSLSPPSAAPPPSSASSPTPAPSSPPAAAAAPPPPPSPSAVVTERIVVAVKKVLLSFRELGYISVSGPTWALTAEKLGEAVCASNIHPVDAATIYRILSKASEQFIADGDLHLCYVVLPVMPSAALGGMRADDKRSAFVHHLLTEPENSDVSRVCSCIGLGPGKLSDEIRGGSSAGDAKFKLRRLYDALILREVVNEISFKEIAKRYSVERSDVLSLQQHAMRHAGQLRVMCERLTWNKMALFIGHLSHRLSLGIQEELTDLVRIEHVKSYRARALYEAGLRTVADVACASHERVRALLTAAQPYRPDDDANAVINANSLDRLSAHIIHSARTLTNVNTNPSVMT